ncbi:MAG TPA: flagellar motor switch protein FliN [Gammaproteobacteria bacterium]|nr:flagellar motor switch protein FliN [Gammaproteobacteria bacterium]
MSEEEIAEVEETTSGDEADPWAEALEEQAEAEAEAEAEEDNNDADPWAGALEEQAEAEAIPPEQLDNSPSASIEPDGDIKLDMILELPVTISMEIGRTKISIRNLLQLTQGSVIELDRLAGEPMDVLVNDTLIAHGEVVVVNDKFGIRLTDVISTHERIKKLR